MRFFINTGAADAKARNSRDRSGLALAIRANHIEVVEFLLRDDCKDAVELQNDTVFHVAAKSGSKGVMALLCQRYARAMDLKVVLNMRNGVGRTALMEAVECPETTISLLKLGANPNVSAKGSANTALMFAAKAGALESLKALLAYGASLRARNNREQTAGELAATRDIGVWIQTYPDRVAAAKKSVITLLAISKNYRQCRNNTWVEAVPRDVWRLLAFAVWVQRVDD